MPRRESGEELNRPESRLPAEGPAASGIVPRRFLETAMEGVLILDGNTGTIAEANPFVSQLLGYSPAELRGRAFWELGPPEDADAAKRAFRRLLAKRHLPHRELLLVSKAGIPLAVEVSGIVYRVNGESVVQCNIRFRKDAGRPDQPLPPAQALSEAGQLVGGLVHDFNHLMAVILGYCEALESQPALSETARQMVMEIHNAGISARNLTQRLVSIDRGQAPQPAAVDLNQAVQRMEKLLARQFGENVQLASSLGAGLASIAADPGQVDRVLMNLAINAGDALPAGGRILIETANVEIADAAEEHDPPLKPGSYVLLTVSDTGQGMDPETQSHIFEPYFSTKAAGQGTGLGLSTVSAIVRQCGGAIGVHSEGGKGTTFKVYFPRCGEVRPAMEQGKQKAALEGTETILLVDDSAALRALMRRILEDSGYTVLESGDPAEALRRAEAFAGPLPLMIADLVLPGFGGVELAEKVLALRPQTQVLYISGYNQDLAARSHLLGQSYVFLEKPFTREDLLAKVRRMLDAPR